MFFTGLRPGEARAAKWSDLDRDGKVLRVHSSMWCTTTTSTKTAASEGVVPICSALPEILEKAKRQSEYILTSPAGPPICATWHIA
jgi:integrase